MVEVMKPLFLVMQSMTLAILAENAETFCSSCDTLLAFPGNIARELISSPK